MATVFETIQALGSIITDAITAGNSANIPAKIIRTSLIRVSTGKYKEVLPIIVPELCCIMGDELRSTNVQPRTIYNAASELIPKGDYNYTYQAINRLENIIGDVVTGSLVSSSIGNAVTQDQSWPFAQTPVVAPATELLARNIKRRIDIDLGLKLETNLPRSYELSVPEYGEHRDILLINKDFIKREIEAYIDTNYPNVKYSRTKCKQDIGFIIDAIGYDLTYACNWQSVVAGEAYWSYNNFVVDSEEFEATKNSYVYLKDVIANVGRNNVFTPLQTEIDQITVTGIGGSTATGNFAAARVQDIIDILDNGVDTVSITYPSLASVPTELQTPYTTMLANLETINDDTIDFILKNFGTFTYNPVKCKRDLNTLLTDLPYDVALGTNFNAVFDGLSYVRSYIDYTYSNQKTETIGAIRYARNEAIISATSDGSSAVGSSNAATRIENAFNEVVKILADGTVGVTVLGDGLPSALNFVDPTGGGYTNRIYAKNNLIANRTFIIAEIEAWIAKQVADNIINTGSQWYNFTYNVDKCNRDVGYIVDAMTYDILYQGTQATTRTAESYFDPNSTIIEGQVTQTSAAYNHLSSVIQDIVQETSITKTVGNTENQTTLGTPATITEANELAAKMTIITDVIDLNSLSNLPAVVYPDISWATSEYQQAFTDIGSDKNTIIKGALQFITDNYTGFVFDHATCTRDTGYILKAAAYDWMLGINFASFTTAYSYLRVPSKKVIGNQKAATLAANEFAKQKFLLYTGANQTVIDGINNTWQIVTDTLFAGATEASNRSVYDEEIFNAIRQLELNKEFIVEECTSYVDNYFKTVVLGTDQNNNTIEIASTSWLFVGMPIKFTDSNDSTGITDLGIEEDATYYVATIESDTNFSITATQYGTIIPIIDYAEGMIVEKAYEYNRILCKRDLRSYIDGIKYDLNFPQQWKREYTDNITLHLPGFYKTKLATRYYSNAVLGSQEEYMYLLRDATGLRLMTLDGLKGDVGPANEYGTNRVTAGAYASLDPGWGPDDDRVWINTRSPYVQNLTTFGYAAIGQKIDGSLHNGGNDSMVSNDFTQVISDGIGAYILNNGRAELVSVFTYYSLIGYLAESGGRVRATNGNNSYGTWGSVAEGVDADEIPVTGFVDNRLQYNAVISQVLTDGVDEILQLEYSHAGNEYTEAKINIFGAGDNEVLIADEFRDEGVFQVRINQIDDSTASPDTVAGGLGYLNVTNVAQTGDTTGISLAATDGNLSTAYPGMKIYITAGAGAGLYGIIKTYDAATKRADVMRESDGIDGWDHVVPGREVYAPQTPNASSTYFIEPAVSFSAPSNTHSASSSITQVLPSFVNFLTQSNIYLAVEGEANSDGFGASFDVSKVGRKYYLTLATGGTAYNRLDQITILGTALGGSSPTNDIIVTVTAVTNGVVTDFEFEGYGRDGAWIAFPNAGSGGSITVDGSAWSSVTLGSPYATVAVTSGLIDDGSSTYKQSVVVQAVENTGTNFINIYFSFDGSNWTSAQIHPAITIGGTSNLAFGQVGLEISRLVYINSQTRAIAYSDNGGLTWDSVADALPTGTGWSAITYGAGRFIALRGGTTTVAVSEDGVTWTEILNALPSVSNWNKIVWGNSRFIATNTSGNPTALSLDSGLTWNETITDVTGTPTDITYGQGHFVVTTDTTTAIYYSADGVFWTAYSVGTYTGGFKCVAAGTSNRSHRFVAIQNSATTNTISARIGTRAKGRASVASEKVFEIRMTEPGSGYTSTPTITITDPNNTADVLTVVRTGTGILAQPSFANRGSQFIAATAELDENESNGFADFFQSGQYIAVRKLTTVPVNGSNVVFDSIPDTVFKLVNTVSLIGETDGTQQAFLQISPEMQIQDAPPDLDPVTMRIRYSQVRLTGHDFLDIGTGNFEDTNYPNEINGPPVNPPTQANETVQANGGRVFFTATDQDGNFRVGDLFSIEQATGVATLNAEAFNIAGLQELTLGEVTLGGNSASITEFSTDPFFTADSDTVVPTQRAIKAYIEAQIGGGAASLIVNSVTAGDIFINTTQITTVTGEDINIKANINFTGAVVGTPLVYNYFLR